MNGRCFRKGTRDWLALGRRFAFGNAGFFQRREYKSMVQHSNLAKKANQRFKNQLSCSCTAKRAPHRGSTLARRTDFYGNMRCYPEMAPTGAFLSPQILKTRQPLRPLDRVLAPGLVPPPGVERSRNAGSACSLCLIPKKTFRDAKDLRPAMQLLAHNKHLCACGYYPSSSMPYLPNNPPTPANEKRAPFTRFLSKSML